MQKEQIRDVASRVLADGIDATLAANERKIAAALDAGRFRLKAVPRCRSCSTSTAHRTLHAG